MAGKKNKNDQENNEAELNQEQTESAESTEASAEPQAKTPEQELGEVKAMLQRVAADYQNYQKRMNRQLEQTRQLAQEGILRSLLAVMDNLDHTLEKGKEAPDAITVLQGVQIISDQFKDVLKGFGMTRIAVKPGDEFDPTRHEALLHEPTHDFAENTIVRELAPGYQVDERILRPAKVSVARKAEEENQGQQ